MTAYTPPPDRCPHACPWHAPVVRPEPVGATALELRVGIGYRWSPPLPGWHPDPLASRLNARAAASRLRARRYETWWSIPGCNVSVPGHPSDSPVNAPAGTATHIAAWWNEREHGIPDWVRESR
jgi:hypothetical protein